MDIDTGATIGETLRCLRALEETATPPIAARAEEIHEGLHTLPNPVIHIPAIQTLRSALESALHLTRQLGPQAPALRINQVTAAIDRASAALGIDLTETTRLEVLSDSGPPSPADSPTTAAGNGLPDLSSVRIVSQSTISSDPFSQRSRPQASAVRTGGWGTPLTATQSGDELTASPREEEQPQLNRKWQASSSYRNPSRSARQAGPSSSLARSEHLSDWSQPPRVPGESWLVDRSSLDISDTAVLRHVTRGAPLEVFYRGKPAVLVSESSPHKLRQTMKVMEGAFHPNLPNVYGGWYPRSGELASRPSEVFNNDKGWIDNNSFTVQEIVRGPCLRDEIRAGTMGLSRKLDSARGAAMALMYLESRAQQYKLATPTISSAGIVWSTHEDRPVVTSFTIPPYEDLGNRQTLKDDKAALSFGTFLEELYQVNRLDFKAKRSTPKPKALLLSDSTSNLSSPTPSAGRSSPLVYSTPCPYLIQEIIVGCVKADPTTRLTIPQIVTMLDMLLLEAKTGPRGYKGGPKHIIPKIHRKYDLRLDARRGDVLAQMELGYRYEFANEVEESADEACRYYRLALEQGYRDAGFALRRCSAKSRDRGAEAAQFYESVYKRDKAHPVSIVRHALVLFWGIGAKANKERAAKILKECITLHGNYPPALHALGCAYNLGHGVSVNMSRAARLFAVAAEKGYSPAQLEYGRFLIAVTKDAETGNFWIAQAVDQNHPAAYHAFAVTLGEEDDNTRAQLEMKAAEQGHGPAQAGLGFCFQKGRGVPLNEELSLKWYRRAADQGLPEAMRQVGWFYLKGFGGVHRNPAVGRDWLIRAKKQGSSAAENDLQKLAPRARKRGVCL